MRLVISLRKTVLNALVLLFIPFALFSQKQAVTKFSSNKFITDWMILGPFPAKSNDALYRDFLSEEGGESGVVPVEGESFNSSSVECGKVSWQFATADKNGKLDLAKYLRPNQTTVAYAAAVIKCKKRTPAMLKLGSNDMLAVWLNGKKVFVHPDPRASGPDADKVAVTLEKGENLLLAKVQNVGGGWWLYARFDELFRLNDAVYITAPAVSPVPKRTPDNKVADIFTVMLYNTSSKTAGPVQMLAGKNKDVIASAERIKPGEMLWLTGNAPGDGAGFKEKVDVDVTLNTNDEAKTFHLEINHSGIVDGVTWFVQGFHVDPVWRDSQSGYQALSFSNFSQFIYASRGDSGFDFVASELPYLKPFYDSHPQERDIVRGFVNGGRIETCGSYNQPNETTISGEALVRNILYGRLFHENVLKDYPRVYQPWDVFGHIIQLPQILKKSEFIGTVWERGNYRSASVPVPGIPDLYFAQSPDGTILPTRKLPYGFPVANGSANEAEVEVRRIVSEDMQEQQEQIPGIKYNFRLNAIDEKAPTAWMVGRSGDFKSFIPLVKLDANGAQEYFEHVQEQYEKDGLDIPVTTRDESQYNEGCELSRFDLKIGNRLGENTLITAEKFASFANILGMPYPDKALDLAWRQLLYGQHHDGITGCGADEPFLDLLIGYHEALELGTKSLDASLDYLGKRIDARNRNKKVIPLVVFNPLNWDRNGLVTASVSFEKPVKGFSLKDKDGNDVPVMLNSVKKSGGLIVKADISFFASNVPSMGYTVLWVVPGKTLPDGLKTMQGTQTIENDLYTLTVDENMGGGIVSLKDKRTGREYVDLKNGHPGNELIQLKEGTGFEPAWRLLTTGEKTFSKDYPAKVEAYSSPLYQKLVITGEMSGMKKRVQEIILYRGSDRIDFRTYLVDYKGMNGKNIIENEKSELRNQRDLYVVRFPVDIEGSVPVLEDRFATKTYFRSKEEFAYSSTSTEWTTHHSMNSCYQWFDNSWSVKVNFGDKNSIALGPSEIVTPRNPDLRKAGFRLQTVLAQHGVTATPAYPDVKREYDIQYRRFSFSAGTLEDNDFNKKLFDKLTEGSKEEIKKQLDEKGFAYAFVYDKGLKEAWFDYPVLMIIGKDDGMTGKAIDKLISDLQENGDIDLPANAWFASNESRVEDYGLALINRGNILVGTEPDGSMVMALMHTIPWQSPLLDWTHDFPERKTHVFDYSVVPHQGNWQDAGLVFEGYEFNNPLIVIQEKQHEGILPSELSFLKTSGDKCVVSAIKPVSAGVEAFSGTKKTAVENGLVVRLYEPEGKKGRVEVETWFPVRYVSEVNLMERNDSPVSSDGNSFAFDLEPYSIETFKMQTEVEQEKAGTGYDPSTETPVYVKFWEQNEGAAPLGYLPVNIRIEASPDIDIDESHKNIREIQVFVTNDYTDMPVKGNVTIETPPGIRAVPAGFTYDVPANSEKGYPVTLVLEGQVTPGFIRANIDYDGMKLFDVLEFRLPRKKFGHADNEKEGTRIKWDVNYQDGLVKVELTNPFSQAVDGMVTLAGSVETWGGCSTNPIGMITVEPWRQHFHLDAGETGTVTFKVENLPGKDEDSFWLIAKLSYFGYLEYKPALGDVEITE